MKKHTFIILLYFICYCAFQSIGQTDIRYKVQYNCDTIKKSKEIKKFKYGKVQLKRSPFSVLYFKNEKEFINCTQQYGITLYNSDNKPIDKINFKKYDVVLVLLFEEGGVAKKQFNIYDQKENYSITLNFIHLSHRNADMKTYSRYILLPKKKKAPDFKICMITENN